MNRKPTNALRERQNAFSANAKTNAPVKLTLSSLEKVSIAVPQFLSKNGIAIELRVDANGRVSAYGVYDDSGKKEVVSEGDIRAALRAPGFMLEVDKLAEQEASLVETEKIIEKSTILLGRPPLPSPSLVSESLRIRSENKRYTDSIKVVAPYGSIDPLINFALHDQTRASNVGKKYLSLLSVGENPAPSFSRLMSKGKVLKSLYQKVSSAPVLTTTKNELQYLCFPKKVSKNLTISIAEIREGLLPEMGFVNKAWAKVLETVLTDPIEFSRKVCGLTIQPTVEFLEKLEETRIPLVPVDYRDSRFDEYSDFPIIRTQLHLLDEFLQAIFDYFYLSFSSSMGTFVLKSMKKPIWTPHSDLKFREYLIREVSELAFADFCLFLESKFPAIYDASGLPDFIKTANLPVASKPYEGKGLEVHLEPDYFADTVGKTAEKPPEILPRKNKMKTTGFRPASGRLTDGTTAIVKEIFKYTSYSERFPEVVSFLAQIADEKLQLMSAKAMLGTLQANASNNFTSTYLEQRVEMNVSEENKEQPEEDEF